MSGVNENGKSRSTIVAEDIAALLRSRAPLIWIITQEEARVEGYLVRAAKAAGYKPYTWDCAAGVKDPLDSKVQDWGSTDAATVLALVQERTESPVERGCFIFRDLPIWLEGITAATTVRQIKNLARELPRVASKASQSLIVITSNPIIPDDLKGAASVIDWPLPDRAEIAKVLDDSLAVLSEEQREKAEPKNGAREEAIQAAIGLTGDQAAACFAKSLVQKKCIDPIAVAQEKKRVIAAEGTITWIDPLAGGADAVGGLENLKSWLIKRKSAFSEKARKYGLPAPRGAFLVGVQGCGKSLTAKAAATIFGGVPLLKIDLGALKGKFVGESEKKIRKAFDVVDAVGRCVVWFDEVEKALAGAVQGGADGGVSADALGTILTWMQERKGESFVMATANNIEVVPPEFYRKGRFDDVWFVDLPNRNERIEILKTALRNAKRPMIEVDYEVVADKSHAFTGSEVAELVTTALFAGFDDGEREITTADLVQAAIETYPLSKTAAEKISYLRKWSEGRARPASQEIQVVKAVGSGRQIDL